MESRTERTRQDTDERHSLNGNGVARIFFWGGAPGTFFVISPGADRIQWGGVVAEIFRDLNYRIRFSGGGGGK